MEDAGLQELKRKLEEEERIYAELLARLDEASENPSAYERDPDLPPLVARLNETWQIQAAPPGPPPFGWRSWLRRLGRRLVDPELEPLRGALRRQESFNASLVRFLNRYMELTEQRAARASELASTLVRFAQRIDRLADAKDRLYASLGNTRTDLLLEAHDKRVETIALGLHRARERLEGVVSTLELARAELRSLRPQAEPPAPRPSRPPPPAPLDSAEYVAFEHRFRGCSEDIRDRLAAYVPYFDGLAPVLELGCGRGEFLALLGEAGIEARGVDDNGEMIELCREQGLDAVEADLSSYLREVPSESTGGIFAAQVIEHLPPARLREMLGSCHRALKKNGRLVVETVNPRSLVALLESFYRDLTHQKPLHPDTLDFLLRACGFRDVRIHYSSPVEERAKLLCVTLEDHTAETLNENFRKLNAILFGDQDYAAVGTK